MFHAKRLSLWLLSFGFLLLFVVLVNPAPFFKLMLAVNSILGPTVFLPPYLEERKL